MLLMQNIRLIFSLSLPDIMRDIVWTVIVIWVIYKLVEIFKGVGQKRSYVYQQERTTAEETNSASKKDIKSATQKRADTEGEYVDFEEIK